MNKYLSTTKAKLQDKQQENNHDLMNFVAQQFKQLTKKHLRVPIQLYTL